MQLPYLNPPLRDVFDGWLAATLGRFSPPLTFAELRRGVQALAPRIGDRGPPPRPAGRFLTGAAKRAAAATYYSALHILITHHALRMVGRDQFSGVRRIVDLGCGAGATSAAFAATLDPPAEVLGVDRSGWVLEEAVRTWRAFGVSGRPRRGELPEAAPRCGRGTALIAGWVVSELDDVVRSALLQRLAGSLRRGAAILVLEAPDARPPWWDEWAHQLRPLGVRDELIRVAVARPKFIRDMDKAARFDHQVIGARLLIGRRPHSAA